MPITDEDGVRRWLTADEAAQTLGVKKETIYAYVSRGRLANRRSDDGRGSLFDAEEIERMAFGSRQASRAGTDTVETALTLITDSGHHYRGQSASDLADSLTFEDAAQLLWGVPSDSTSWTPAADLVSIARHVVRVLPRTMLPVDEIKIVASCVGALEPPEWNTSAAVIATSARRVFATIVSGLPELSEPELSNVPPGSWMAAMLWSRLCKRRPTGQELDLLNRTMVVLADHGLASATMMARAAAGSAVNAAGIIRLGVEVGSGPVKGAASLAIESFLHNIEDPESVEKALTMRLRQGEPIPGFGHSLYPNGDPRATYILDRLRTLAAGSKRLATVEELLRMQRERGLPQPNAGFAIAAFTYVTGMVPGAGEAIFVISRAAGWIAHAIEAYSVGPVMPRPQSRYTGPRPLVRA